MTSRPLSAVLARLVWLSLLPLLLVAGSLAVFHVYSERTATRAAAERRLVNYAAQIDGFLEARILALNMLASSPLADDPKRWAELYAEAQAFHASFGSHVIFADAGRQMLFNTRVPFGTALPRLPEARKGRSAAPIALETGKPTVGDIVQGPVINEALVAIVVPGLRDAQVRYLMLVTTTTRELQRRVDAIPMEGGWVLSVRDSAGELVARQAPASFDPARDVDDEWRFAAKSRFSPWAITVEVPRNLVRKPLFDSLAILLLAIVLATLAGQILGRRVAGRVVRQVAALAEPGAAAPPADIAEIAAVGARIDSSHAALRERDHKLSAIIGFSPSALSLKTPDGRYALANPNLQRIHHCSEEQIVGKTDFDLYPEATARVFRTNDQQVLDSGTMHSIEEIVPVDGEPRSYMSHVFPVRDDRGMIEYICRISLDISERKAVERALAETQAAALAEQHRARVAALNLMEDAIAARQQGEKFFLLAESSSDFIGMCDLEMTPLYVNPAGRRMVGLPDMAAACRVKVQDYYFPEDRRYIAEEFFPRVLRDGHGDVEIRLRHFQTGAAVWVFYYLFRLLDAGGTPVGWATVSRDITEQKRAETTLTEQLDELRRWQQAMIGREDRIITVKQEVNELLAQLGQPPRYTSARVEGTEK
ncbi:MAG: PAS domain-containing protein [Sulfuritalea sp.]|nr:PAS domain-containing protein [Sulfuritalea sp.]